jgi:Helix-turn-helix domain
MDRDLLERYLANGKSLGEIGALVGRHPSTVAYWLHKHGLVANGREAHSSRGAPDRKGLEAMAAGGATLAEIATALDRSVTTVRFWLNRWEIPRERPRSRVPPDPESAPLDVEMECARHGVTLFRLEGRGYYRCKRCRQARVSEWRRGVKRRLVAEAGGSCEVCGYDRCVAALQFHHRDPATKRFIISRQGVTRSFAETKQEASKCMLLCANCHAEVEAGLVAVEHLHDSSKAPPGGLEPP